MSLISERGVIRTALELGMTAGQTYDVSGSGLAQAYPWPVAAVQMELISANAADTAAGTGVQQIELNLVDAGFNSQTILVATNGASTGAIVDPVSGNDLWFRCNGMRATQGGATAQVTGAVGAINLEPVGGADILAQIVVNGSRWNGCLYTIPIDEVIQLKNFGLSIYNASNQAELIGSLHSRRPDETVWNGEVSTSVVDNVRLASAFSIEFLDFAFGTDLVVRVNAVSGTTNLDAFGRLSLHRDQKSGVL